MIQVSGDNCLEAWVNGCEIILEHGGDVFNLCTTIKNPNFFEKEWLVNHDPKIIYSDNASLSDVINTIFPYKIKKIERSDLYSHYLKLHGSEKRLGCKKRKRWGTYFERMISFGLSEVNQIEEIIDVVNSDKRHLKTLNPIHISSCEYDSLKKRLGNPCLQYVQFTFPRKDTINITVVYRNHDFLSKALGNFIGLGKLLDFVAQNTDKQVGELTCLSTHAFTNSKKNLIKIANL